MVREGYATLANRNSLQAVPQSRSLRGSADFAAREKSCAWAVRGHWFDGHRMPPTLLYRAIPDSMDPSSTSGGVEQGGASIGNTPAVEEAQPAADAAGVVANAGAGGVAAVPATAASGVEESKTAASAKPAATPAVEPVSTVTAVPPEDVLELVASSCRTCVASATHVSVDAAAVSAWVASLSADDARELGDATASGLPLTFETPESAVNFWGTLRWCLWMCVLSPPTLSACRSDGSP